MWAYKSVSKAGKSEFCEGKGFVGLPTWIQTMKQNQLIIVAMPSNFKVKVLQRR